MAPTPIDFDLMGALRAAGIADNGTQRVVIDLRAGHLPVVYVERLGDEALIQVIDAVSQVRIVRGDGDSDGGQ